jgi:hypothetical protein
MCGIAGYLDFTGRLAQPALLQRMSEAIRHRGPNDHGVYVDGSVGLAHRRLSILDLSSLGHQPMLSDDGQLALTYNGEVYNYVELRAELEASGRRFRSGTDAEVVLAAYEAWGPRCVLRFTGMWALALWDRVQRRLWLSRDRFGVKPLHYARKPGRVLAFASEAKALLAIDPDLARPNPVTLRRFLELGALEIRHRRRLRLELAVGPVHDPEPDRRVAQDGRQIVREDRRDDQGRGDPDQGAHHRDDGATDTRPRGPRSPRTNGIDQAGDVARAPRAPASCSNPSAFAASLGRAYASVAPGSRRIAGTNRPSSSARPIATARPASSDGAKSVAPPHLVRRSRASPSGTTARIGVPLARYSNTFDV